MDPTSASSGYGMNHNSAHSAAPHHPLMMPPSGTGLASAIHRTAPRGHSYDPQNVISAIREGIAAQDPSSSSMEHRYTRTREPGPGTAIAPARPPPRNAASLDDTEPEQERPPTPPERPTNVGVVVTSDTVKPPYADPRKVARYRKLLEAANEAEPGGAAARNERIEAALARSLGSIEVEAPSV
ncbi:hypothetical protein FRC01_009911 [Tulasnella sp. 417]|nr:hypothetical protein FRC01_009911 [Tulasnella sp. 417]